MPDVGTSTSLTASGYEKLWCGEWNFTRRGSPEDAASYLEEVLAAIKNKTDLTNLWPADGLQDFMFQWLHSVGLVTSELSDEATLTEKGERLLHALDARVHYPLFGLDPHDGLRS
jgi:hypothetical protein